MNQAAPLAAVGQQGDLTRRSKPKHRRFRTHSFVLHASAETDAFAHSLEQELARGLRAACDMIPIGEDISQSDGFRVVVSALECYLPAMLREVHLCWKHESLDGVFHEKAVKTAARRAEIAGHCIRISDQTLTPFHVQLGHALNVDEIEWLDCRLGEVRGGVMVRIPYSRRYRIRSVSDRLHSIEWKFHIGFGDIAAR